MDFCPGRLFRLGMLCTHLSELSRLKKNNNISNKYLVYIKPSRAIHQIFSLVTWKVSDFIFSFRLYLTFTESYYFWPQKSFGWDSIFQGLDNHHTPVRSSSSEASSSLISQIEPSENLRVNVKSIDLIMPTQEPAK